MSGNIEKIDVNGYGGRELRDSPCGGFYFVCAVGGKIFFWALVERWLGGTGEGFYHCYGEWKREPDRDG